MDQDSAVVGVAVGLDWERGYPTAAEYNAFMDLPEAFLRVVRVDGREEAKIPLRWIPPSYGEDEFVFPAAVRAGDVARWDVPKWVATLRLSVRGKGYYYLYMKPLAIMEGP